MAEENPVVGGEKPAKQPRTPAQAEASRRNGAKSRGPTSPAGKEHSSRNALKHGILARKIGPADSLENRQYRELLEELVGEYEPQTISEHNTVEMLAMDLVQVCRVARYREAFAIDPPQPAPEAKAVDFEQQIRTVEEVRQSLQAEGYLGLPAEEIRWLAPLITERLGRLLEDGRSLEKKKSAELQPFEAETLRLYRLVKPETLAAKTPKMALDALDGGRVDQPAPKGARRPRYQYPQCDLAAVEKQLASTQVLDEPLRGRWMGVLDVALIRLRESLEWAERRRKNLPLAQQHRLDPKQVIAALDGLEKAERYETRLRRHIDQAIAFLEKRIGRRHPGNRERADGLDE